jgi:PAS domain S-box-containing protein
MNNKQNLKVEDFIKAMSMNSMLMITDVKGTFTEVNKHTCEVTGYGEEELIDHNYEDIFGKDATQQEHIMNMLATVEKGQIWQGEVKRFTKSGDAYWTYTIVYPIKNEEDKTTGFLGISQVITRSKLIAEQFYNQNKQLNAFAFTNSHILRHPLATILGLCGLVTEEILDTARDCEQVKETIKHITRTAKELDIAVHQMQAYVQQAKNEQKQVKVKLTGDKSPVKRMMLIDDDDLSHLITQRILQYATNFTLEVLKFKSTKEALDYLINEINPLPDMILLDLDMPHMDGWDFLKEFGKLHIGIPINILTNSVWDRDKYKAINHEEVKGFWHKPLKVDQVSELLTAK